MKLTSRKQRIQVRVLALLLICAALLGWRAWRDYARFQRGLALRDRGDQLSSQGHPAEAIEAFQGCVAVYPQFVDAWTALSELHLERKDFGAAERCLDEALRFCPGGDEQKSVIYRERGSLFLRIGQKQKAADNLTQACRLDPKDGLAARLLKKSLL